MAITEDLIAKIEIETGNSQKNVSSLTREISFLDKQIKILGEDIDKVFSSSQIKKSIIETAKNVNVLEKNINALDVAIVSTNNSINKFGFSTKSETKEVESLSQSAASLVLDLGSMVSVFKTITDPEMIERFSKILNMISIIAKLKGFNGISEQFSKASDDVEGFKKILSENTPTSIFDDVIDKLIIINNSLLAAKIAAIGAGALIAGSMLLNIPIVFDKVSESVNRASKSFNAFSEMAINKLDKQFIKTAETLRNRFNPGLFGIIEASFLLSPALIGIGEALQNTDNDTLKFIGRISFLAGILTGGFGAAVLFATNAIAGFSISIGDKLIDIMEVFEEKAIKAETSLKLFQFTVEGFNKELGVEATGSLQLWNNMITEVANNSIFSASAIQKSIKILVAEGQALHLSVSQNQEILKRAADIATVSGENLEDVIVKIVQGISGNSQALIALGINVSQSGLEHGKLAKQMGKTVSSMTDAEVQALRLNEIFEQTKPIVGAAAASLDTISAANIKYDQSIQQLQASLGKQSSITAAYTNAITLLVRHLNDLPEIVLNATSTLIDFGGVTLKIIGYVAKYGLTIVTLTSIYKIANSAIASHIFLQTSLSTVFSIVAKAAGIQAVAVTTLSAAFANLGIIARGLLLSSLKSIIATTITLTKTIWILTASILKNPLFWKATAIVGAIFVIIEAYKQLAKELKHIDNLMLSSNERATETVSIFSTMGNFLSNVFQRTVSFVKVIMVGLLQLYEVTKLAANGYKLLWAEISGNKQLADEARQSLYGNILVLGELGESADGAWATMTLGLVDTAMAAENTKKSIDNLHKSTVSLSKVDIDLSDNLKIEVFGTEAQKAILDFHKANLDLNRLMNKQGKDLKEVEEIEKEIQSARESAGKAFLNLQKSQIDIQKDFESIRKNAAIKQLEDSGMLVEAEKLKQIEIRNSFDKQVEAAKEFAKITGLPVKGIRETIKALEDQKIAAINAAQVKQDEEKLKPFLDDLKRITDQTKSLNEEVQRAGESQFQAIERISKSRLDEILQLKNKLEIEGLLTDEKRKQLELAEKSVIDSSKEQAKAIGKVDVIPQGTIDALQNAVGSGASAFASAINSGLSSFASVASAVMSAAEAVVGFVQKIIDFIPQIINAIANIFTSLTNLPKMIMEAFKNLFSGITEFISDFLPNLLNMGLELLTSLVDFLVEGIPAAFESLLEKLPETILNLLDNLPDIMEKLIIGLINFIPRIMIAAMEFIIDDAPKIALKMMEVFLIELPKAIIHGFIKAADELVRRLQAFFSGKSFIPKEITDFGKNLGDGIKNLAKNVAKESSNVFKVLDLEAEARAASADPSAILKDAARTVNEILMDFLKFLKKTWMWIWEKILEPIANLLKKAWMWVWENVIEPIANLVKKAWKWVWDNVIEPIANVFKKIWMWTWENWVEPFLKVFKAIWMWAWETVINPMIEGLVAAWTWIQEKIITPIVDAFKILFGSIRDNVFRPIIDGFRKVFSFLSSVLEPINKIFYEAFAPIIDFFNSIFKTNIKDAFKPIFESFENVGKKIYEGFKSGLDTLGTFFSDLGTSIWNGLKSGLDKLGVFLTNILDAISPKNLFEKMFKVDNKGQGTVEKALNIDVPFMNFASGGEVPGRALVPGDSLLNDRVLALLSPGETVIPRSIMDNPELKSIIDAVMSGKINPEKFGFGGTLGKITQGDFSGAVSDIAGAGEQIVQGAADTIDQVFSGPLKELWNQVKDLVFNEMIWKMFESNKFHQGGLVPAMAGGGEVPSILQPGEYVMRRGAVNSLGTAFLDRLNQGGRINNNQKSGNVVINVDMKIEASSQKLDETYVRNKLIPSIKDELKKSSLRGEFLIGERGIRKA